MPAELTTNATDSTTVGWHLAAHVVFPGDQDSDVLPLYVEYGSRAPGLDDPHDRHVRRWGEYKGSSVRRSHGLDDRVADVVDRRSIRIPSGERVSLATYFNAFPASYWRRWTVADAVRLEVAVAGTATVIVYRSNARGTSTRLHSLRTGPGEEGFDAGVTRLRVDLDLVPFADGGWYWFDVVGGADDAILHSADWLVRASLQRSQTVSVGVTTVNKVDYVDRLVGVIAADIELQSHLDTVWIVDQGTVSVESGARWSESASRLGDKLRVVPQANLGGSGGFSRGMLETLREGRSTFHLVLDDDVRLEPEAVLRAVRFGSFASRPTIVGAHMFDLNAPTTLHSFGEVVDPVRWTFSPALGVHEEWDLAASGLRETPWLHRRTDVNYNGWWMCLIPTAVLEAVGLSLPIFIKWDDAEHCLRAGAAGFPTVTLPGAGVWHVSWNDKDDVSEWQAYFHQRNLLISALLHSRQPKGGQAVMQSFQWLVKHGYSMRYYANAIRLRGLRDLFDGPEHLHDTLGTTLPELRALTSEFVDVQPRRDQSAFPSPAAPLGGAVPRMPSRRRLLPWAARTGIRHLRPPTPDAAIKPQTAIPARYAVWWFLSQYDSAVVSKQDGTGVAWYQRNPVLFKAQMKEGLALHLRLHREWDALALRYQGALSEITSPRAWARTFGLDEPARDGQDKH